MIVELTMSLFMFSSMFTSVSGATAQTDQGTANDTQTATPVQTVVSPTPAMAPVVSTETYVRNYFKDTPILAEIARCESTFRQYDKEGNVLRGKVNKGDIGVMQINKYYHEEDATKLGLDIYTIDGNLKFAEHLYKRYGSDPWSSSSKCWKGNPIVAER